MTPAREPGRPAVVTPLRRPPVRQSVHVRSDIRPTFDTFVRTIGTWWPVQPLSAGKDRVRGSPSGGASSSDHRYLEMRQGGSHGDNY